MTRTLRKLIICAVVFASAIGMAMPVTAQEPPRDTVEIPELSVSLHPMPPALAGSTTVELRDDDRRDNEQRTDRALDKKFWLLGAALGGSMAIDTYSTYRSNAWCPTCKEQNPYAAPFINSGPATAYAAGAAFDVGVMALSAAMRKSENPALRRIWWAPPVLLIFGHGLAARHNFNLREGCAHNPQCGR